MSCLHCFNGRFGFTLFVNTPYFRTDTITNNPLIRADYLAGKGGFEPPVEFYPNNHLAGGPIQPLWHLPIFNFEYYTIFEKTRHDLILSNSN